MKGIQATMCAPIAMTGLQLAGTIASAAAGARDMRRQAAEAERAARADADVATARAGQARDDALSRTAALRVRAFASGVDPKSESLVESLASAHARNLGEADALGHAAARMLFEGQARARALRASRQSFLARSLLGLAGTLAEPQGSGNRLRL
jgi:hypothetical protein